MQKKSKIISQIIILLGIFVFFALFYVLGIFPYYHKQILQLNERIKEEKTNLLFLEKNLSHSWKIKRSTEKEIWSDLQKSYLSKEQLPEFLSAIEKLAEKFALDLEFSHFTPNKGQAKSFSYKIQVRGNFSSVMNFLESLENLPFLHYLDSALMEKEKGRILGEFQGKIFLQ